MISVNPTYSCTLRCDSYTGMSIGLSLMAVLVTTAVFVVLAHRGYVSPTIAYSMAPSIGTAFILTGIASALIRKNNPTLVKTSQFTETDALFTKEMIFCFLDPAIDPSQTFIMVEGIVLGEKITLHPPDLTHPYAYYTVTLNPGNQRISGVEILGQEEPNAAGLAHIVFIYQGKQHIGPIQVFFKLWSPILNRNIQRNAFKQWDEELALWSGKRYLSKKKYAILMEEGSSAEVFRKSDLINLDNPDNCQGMLFEMEGFISLKQEGSIITFQKKQECPQGLRDGLQNHPAVMKKLSATEWTWNLIENLSFISVITSNETIDYSVESYTAHSQCVEQNTSKKRKATSVTDEHQLWVISFFENMKRENIPLFPPKPECLFYHYSLTTTHDGLSVQFFYCKVGDSFNLIHRLLT